MQYVDWTYPKRHYSRLRLLRTQFPISTYATRPHLCPVAQTKNLQKYMTARAAELACKNSIQAHGAMGYTWEMDLHIYMRKAWSLMACWGNEDKQQDIIYKTLTASRDELGVLYTF